MKTVTVELRSNKALRLLKDLELANIIRVLDKDIREEKAKVSASLRGAITKERAQELNKQLNQMRNEWDIRSI
ncbi:MAG: hypothetical protein EA361_19330 [Bacteroidetes bacterium]|nr:MAG: hypothetical protein EA361_19330 [Bacteroidota bacterium]